MATSLLLRAAFGSPLRAKRSNLLVVVAMLAACSPEEPPVAAPTHPVVVYAAEEYEGTFHPLFEQFEQETGSVVIVRYGDAGQMVDDVIKNDISPSADILLTSTVMEAWRAAEEGALRPIHSQVADESIPAWAMDPDSLWLGLAFDAAVIVSAGIDPPSDYADLADERFTGHLCLSSAAFPGNQVVIAMLIDQLDVRQAELAVRGWINNLALPPFDRQEALAGALQDGRCQLGIVPASIAEASGLERFSPPVTYGDIDAIGIARHARNPDGALRLIEWLIEGRAPEQFAHSGFASHRNVGLAAWHQEDAMKLAERAGYR